MQASLRREKPFLRLDADTFSYGAAPVTQTSQRAAMETAVDIEGDMRPFTDDGLPRTLWWDDRAGVLRMIDQTLLPSRCEVLTCADAESVAVAIRTLRVRGAPAIGVAAAYGLALG